jgi:hypothetical protein
LIVILIIVHWEISAVRVSGQSMYDISGADVGGANIRYF